MRFKRTRKRCWPQISCGVSPLACLLWYQCGRGERSSTGSALPSPARWLLGNGSLKDKAFRSSPAYSLVSSRCACGVCNIDVIRRHIPLSSSKSLQFLKSISCNYFRAFTRISSTSCQNSQNGLHYLRHQRHHYRVGWHKRQIPLPAKAKSSGSAKAAYTLLVTALHTSRKLETTLHQLPLRTMRQGVRHIIQSIRIWISTAYSTVHDFRIKLDSRRSLGH
jgi:hypothetical protein